MGFDISIKQEACDQNLLLPPSGCLSCESVEALAYIATDSNTTQDAFRRQISTLALAR
jgi:hypothetical protein